MSLTSRELPVANQPHNSKKLKANTSVNVKPDLDDGRNQQKAPTQNDTDREPNKDFETWESCSFCVQEDENEANSQPPRSSEFVQPHQDPFANPPIPSDLHFEGFDWGLPVENQDPPESSGFDLNELLLRPDVRDLLLPPSPSTDPAETEPLDFQNCPVNFDPPEGKYVVDQTDSYISSFPPNCELHDVFNNLDSPDPVCNLTETEGVEELKRSENCESESSNNLPSISGHHPTAPTGIQFNDDDEFYGGPCIDPKVFQILIPKGDISSLENLFTPTTTEDTAEIAPEDPILDATSNEAPTINDIISNGQVSCPNPTLLIPKGDTSSLENLSNPSTSEVVPQIAPEDRIIDAPANEASRTNDIVSNGQTSCPNPTSDMSGPNEDISDDLAHSKDAMSISKSSHLDTLPLTEKGLDQLLTDEATAEKPYLATL